MKYAKYLGLILLFVNLSTQAEAQKVFNNAKGEIVCIDSTNLTFKLYGSGGIITWVVGKAEYRIYKDKYKLRNQLDFGSRTSKIFFKDSLNQSAIQVLYSDSTPVQFPFIQIKDLETNHILLEGHGNESGSINLGDFLFERRKEREVIISVRSLDFSTDKKLNLQADKTYQIISCLDFPFMIISGLKNIKIQHLTEEKIEVFLGKKERILELVQCQSKGCNNFCNGDF